MRLKFCIWLLFSFIAVGVFSQENTTPQTEFARFVSSERNYDFYNVNLSKLNTPFKRMYFYDRAVENGVLMNNKSQIISDSATFFINKRIGSDGYTLLLDLLSRTENAASDLNETSQLSYLKNTPYSFLNGSGNNGNNSKGPMAGPDCQDANVFCGSAAYVYNAGVNAGSAEPGPFYDCLSNQPNPAWFFLQIGPPGGNVVITITSSPPQDIDFICWGPFSSPTGACASGLTAGTVVDCSYAGGTGPEICDILNTNEGEFYLFLLTNFSNSPCDISFLQTNVFDPNAATTNCDIVVDCSLLSISTTATTCDPATNKFSVSGDIEFTNPPATGTLTVTDVISGIFQTISAPFNSPQPYLLSGITCDGNSHSISAVFSADAVCTKTVTYSSPPNACPIGSISGSSSICNDGISKANVSIDLIGAAPFNFTYAINGVPQTPITNYSGAIPFIINTNAPGNYTLVSLSNAACAGTVSGSATITLNPLPVPSITGLASLCVGSTSVSYTSPEASNHNYLWTITGGTIIGGQGSSTISVNWTASGPQQLTVTCQGPAPTNCAPATPATFTVNVDPVPVVEAGPDATICQGDTYTVSGASVLNGASYSWSKVTGLGTITGGSTYTPTYTPTATETGDVVLSLTASGLSTCSAVSDQVTIHILPMVTADAGTDNAVCQNGIFKVSTATALNYKNLVWTAPGGTGTLTDETTLTPSYAPGAGETGPVTLTLTASGNPPCGNVVDSFILTVNPPVTADAGPAGLICETGTFNITGSSTTNEVSWLWTAPGTGTFDDATILHPTFTPDAAQIAAGNVTLTLTAAALPSCAAAISTVLLNISRQVVLDAGPDGPVCQNAPFVITGASEQFSNTLLWTSNGLGTITNETTINPTYTPLAGESGVVTLTLTGDPFLPCSQVIDAMQLTIHPLPTADAGLSGASCQDVNYLVTGAAAQFQSSVAWTENGPGSLSNPNTLSPTYIPLAGETGTVTLTLTAYGSNSCASEVAISTRTLTIHALPDVNAGANATICAASTFPVSGIHNFTSSVLWTTSGDGGFAAPGSASTIYTPGPNDILAGSVVLTFTGTGDGACLLTNDADQLTLTIDPMPAINAGPDGLFCVQAPIALTGTSALHYSTLQWTRSGDGTFSDNTIQSPTYNPGNIDFNNGTVTLTMRAFGQLTCAAMSVVDTRVLTVSAYPVIYAGPDDYICSNVTTYQLTGVGNNYNLGNIQWMPSGGDGTLNNPNIINPVYSAGAIDLSTLNRNITFTLTVQGIGTCSSVFINDQVVLKIDPTPVSNSGPDDEICGRNPYQLNATAQYQSFINWTTSGDGGFSDKTILNPTYTPGPNDVGNVVVLTLDLSGCKSLTGGDFLWLTVHPDPGATIKGTTSICEGVTTPVRINLTGTAPWSITYTNGTSPVTVANILSSPYIFNVNPSLTTNWWITAANDAFCTAPADSIDGLVTVTVFPLPDKFTTTVTNDGVFCEGTAGVFIGLNGSQTGMNYELWQNGINTGNLLPGNGSPLNFGIVNVPGQYSIRGINPAGNCEAMMNDTVNVIMNPIPVTDFVSTTPCFGDSTEFTVSGQYINSTSYWQWNFGDGDVETFNAPKNPKHVYPAPGFYTVTLHVGDTNNCLYSVSHPVEVRPHPVAFFSFDTPNCIGSPAFFTDLSNNTGIQGYLNQWIWDFGDGSPVDTVDFPVSPNITHDYLNSGTYLVTLTVMNSRSCGDTYSMPVTMTNRPVADFIFTTGCQLETTSFTDLSDENSGGQIVNLAWDFGDPGSGANNTSILQNPVHSYSNSGVYLVTLIITNLNGCKDTIQKSVNVKARPLANFFSSPGCLNSPTLFLADSIIINIDATATFHWDFGEGQTSNSRNSTHNYLSPGTFDVILTITDTAGCIGTVTLPVTVNPPPNALFSANTDNCQGQSVAFTNQSTSLTGFISQWEWDFGDGNTQTILFPNSPATTHTYAGTGTFSVTLTVTNSEGCTHSVSRLINSLGAPTSDFTFSGHCMESPVSFTDVSGVSGLQSLSAWHWNFGDPTSGVLNTSTLQNPTHTFAGTGTYLVELITFTGNNCSDTLIKNLVIKAKPVVDFNTQSACAGNAAMFTPFGMNAAAIATWNWSFGDGSTSTAQAPSYTYPAAGTYTVILTVSDTAGCSNSQTKTIVIAPLPSPNFGYTTPSCQGDAVSFSDMSSTTSGYVARWDWDFGDGNTQTFLFPAIPNVTHLYANAGTFNVKLTVKTNDSCTNFITRVVTILPKPTADFLHGAACQGSSVTFTDQSISNTTGGISEWAWNFGDPTSGTANTSGVQHPSHSYNLAGTYTVTLVVAIPGGCSDTTTMPVVVSPPPTVDFTQVAGCNGDTTQFTSSASVNMAATQGWYWQFGDGTTSFVADPMHIYASAGTYAVTLTITDTAGCTSSKIKPVIVIPGPLAAFSSSSPGCSGLPITFTDLSNANGGSLSTWHWDFGDGTDTTYNAAAASFEHTYAGPGTFQVTLDVLSALGCENAAQHTVTISPSPISAFTYTNTCQGQSTQFSDATSLNGGSSLTQRAWNFGDPSSGTQNTSALTNPTHTFTQPGDYTVTLFTMNGGGCSDTVQQNVTIFPKPTVDFYNDSLVCLGSTTTLYADTAAINIGAIQYYEWDFGDGSPHAFTQNASHSYTVAGTFTVTLIVQDTAGCSNIKTHTLTIHKAPVSTFTYTGVCQNAPTLFTDLSVPPVGDTIVSWYWDFGIAGTTDTSTLQNPEFTYTTTGTYTVTLTTTTENGCSHSNPLPIQVWNTPTANFKYTASPCDNGLVQFQDSSWSYQGTVNSWQWEFEPYQYGTGKNPSHLYYAVDSCYDVKLVIEDLRGCVDTLVKGICVPAELTVDFTTSLTCFGSPVLFTSALLTPQTPPDSLISFSWNFGDPATGTHNVSQQRHPLHTFSSIGFYTVNFTTTDKYGCSATAYQTVQVNALPTASFSYSSGQCDSTLLFSSTSVDTSAVISMYIWLYGDGSPADTTLVPASTHKYTSSGQYITTLTVVNANGCTDTYSDTVNRTACLNAAYLGANDLLCQNYDLAFTDMSTCDGTITQWDWNFGDGTPSTIYNTYQPTVNHTFVTSGLFTIKLKVSTQVGTSTLSDSTQTDILVKPTPLAGFTVDPVCLGTKAEFADTTHANGATVLLYSWEFGDAGRADTSVLRNPDYLYTVPGSYLASLVVKNQYSCADTATSEVTVNGLPQASYANSLACAGQQTFFFDASLEYAAPVITWGWRVKDSVAMIGSMQGATPTYIFDSTGTYFVRLMVADTNGCADTIVQQVTVNASPVSAFSYTENVENIQGQIQFTNGSLGAEEYYWSFGDGATSYAESPLITYADDGTYPVMLVAVSEFGCHDTTLITYDMMFKGLYVPNAFAPGGTIQATRYWKPVGVNLATYDAEVYNSYGMLIWSSTLLDEKGAPAESWDGTYKGTPCQQDVYVWKISGVFRDGSIWYNTDVGEHEGLSAEKWGTITLIR